MQPSTPPAPRTPSIVKSLNFDEGDPAPRNTKKLPVKDCRCCLALLSSPDEVDPQSTLAWAYPNFQGRQCLYCCRVHEKKCPTASLRDLAVLLQKPDEKARFMNYRAQVVDLKRQGILRITALPDESVTQETGAFDRVVRRGKYMRLDIFQAKYPNVDPSTYEVSRRKDRAGRHVLCVKVYNDEDGVWSFSEGEEDRVRKEKAGHIVY